MKPDPHLAADSRLVWVASILAFFLMVAEGCGDNECIVFGNNPNSCQSQGGNDLADAAAAWGDLDVPVTDSLDTAGEVRPPYYPPDATPQQIEALQVLNEVRGRVGLPAVDEDDKLNAAAQAHAIFLVKNCSKYASTGLSPHFENSEWDGFVGEDVGDRVQHFGYNQGYAIGEVIAFVNSPRKAVEGWIGTLYHRLPLLDPGLVEVGYGNAGTGNPACEQSIPRADVMDVALDPPSSDITVVYPPDGATNVPTFFDGMESPQPPAPPDGFPSGYIITVQFANKLGVTVLEHVLSDDAGNQLQHKFLAWFEDREHGVEKDPYAIFGDRYLAMYAHKPLKPKTTYTVTIELQRGAKPVTLKWSFTTGKF